METDRTLIVVPTYNERENVGALIPQLFQIAPDAAVIELRRRERPLRVALAALGRQRVAVHVVLAVAVQTQVAAARERTVVLVAAFAREVVVRALEREVADVM